MKKLLEGTKLLQNKTHIFM